ncbi:DUF5134 domain-containing protein [Amycolatopsis nigrescens]|uniref:DUF5134 domain-containing protein n=1 Tax=Amycolatopsis nigrescens TaxID=381445 RepID=UPI000371CB61|nr:DUF5134 domain-containing protein [Amycolatopsis nigrescens]
MHTPVVVGWLLTAVFLLITLPCVRRLSSFQYGQPGQSVRGHDVADLMLAVAMVAMVSPVGGPIPAAGWLAVLGAAALWFLCTGLRARETRETRSQALHHAVSALAMCYLVAAMPHGGHGPWLNMSTMDVSGDVSGGMAWPVVAVLTGYFAVDAVRHGLLAVRPGPSSSPGFVSRAVFRSVMGLGMGYMFVAAL